MMDDKGQVLVMTAIVIILTVVAIRIEFDSIGTAEDFEFQTGRTSAESFGNIKDEMVETARLAFTENPDDSHTDASLNSFAERVRERDDFTTVYASAHFNPGASNELEITVRNLLDEDLESVTVESNASGTSTSVTLGDLSIGESKLASMSPTVTSESLMQVNVTYTGVSTGEESGFRFTAFVGPAMNYTTTTGIVTIRTDDSPITDTFSVHIAYNDTSTGSLEGVDDSVREVVLTGPPL